MDSKGAGGLSHTDKVFSVIEIFRYKCPVPFKWTFDAQTSQIKVLLGQNEYHYPVYPDVAAFDYIPIIENDLIAHYPKYLCEVESFRRISKAEMVSLVAEDVGTIDQAMNTEKRETRIERGMIYRLYMKADQFQLIANGIESIRQSTMPISSFIKTVRFLTQGATDEEMRRYIFGQSVEVVSNFRKNPLKIQYSPAMTLNFFRINMAELLESEAEISDHTFTSKRFKIFFPDSATRQKCLDILERKDSFFESAKVSKGKTGVTDATANGRKPGK